MKAYYSDHFVLPLLKGHRFPTNKYRRLRERIGFELPSILLEKAKNVTDGELAFVHKPAYIEAVEKGQLTSQAQKKLVFHGAKC